MRSFILLLPAFVLADCGQSGDAAEPSIQQAPPAVAATQSPAQITEWTVPWERTRPRDPYVDGQGRVWFVGQEGNYVATLDPEVAARALASYFRHRPGLVEACEREDWREVRRLVNGEYRGWERFEKLVLPLAVAAVT